VAWSNEFLGAGVWTRGYTDCLGAVGSADAGGDAFAGLDGDGEGSAKGWAWVSGSGHHRQTEPFDLLFDESEADEASSVHGHKVEGFGGNEIGSHSQVALIFPIFVVNENNHTSSSCFINCTMNARQESGIDIQSL
jgi:hypothetical protein